MWDLTGWRPQGKPKVDVLQSSLNVLQAEVKTRVPNSMDPPLEEMNPAYKVFDAE